MDSAGLFRFASAMIGLALLAACSPHSDEKAQSLTRPEAYWPDRSIVFLADAQAGVVRAFNIRSGIVPLGEIIIPARAPVLALFLDVSGKRLWVLDHGALHAHDAITLRLLRRWPAPDGIVLKALERDADGVVLAVAADGRRYRPDPKVVALKTS